MKDWSYAEHVRMFESAKFKDQRGNIKKSAIRRFDKKFKDKHFPMRKAWHNAVCDWSYAEHIAHYDCIYDGEIRRTIKQSAQKFEFALVYKDSDFKDRIKNRYKKWSYGTFFTKHNSCMVTTERHLIKKMAKKYYPNLIETDFKRKTYEYKN